ncbi:lysoplasmalogenase [Nocardioides sp. W7]|uniref:lysoplasmalogenase n=1 Tax=Nocardioides sp. W7 TaxID=2931390 RepID=UPI001FD306BD|nr:lysoplasmalogenase [Nocardioides sp. W7]
MSRPPLVALGGYVALAAVHVTAQLAEAEKTANATQVLLMPLLAVALVLLAGTGPRLVRLTLVALAFSWLGDSVPRLLDGDPAFLAMVGFFLLAQATYIVAFRPYAGRSVLTGPRPVLAAYLIPTAALMALTLPGAGVLAPAVLVYGGCLLAMALLASGVHPLAWAGGAVFAVSDALIALGAFADGFEETTLGSAAVMATYTLAQLLIVLGVVARTRADGAAR